MTIDFNHVRRIALDAYTALVGTLERRRDGDGVQVRTWEIEEDLEDLRQALVGIGATYVDGDDEFRVVLKDDEVLPTFNPSCSS